MEIQRMLKKSENDRKRKKIKRRAAQHFATNCDRRLRSFQQLRRRRDASITLNLPPAFSAVCPLSLFVVTAGKYAAAVVAI